VGSITTPYRPDMTHGAVADCEPLVVDLLHVTNEVRVQWKTAHTAIDNSRFITDTLLKLYGLLCLKQN